MNDIESNNISMEEQHGSCPREIDTWYKFWYDKHHNNKTYTSDNQLPSVFIEQLKPIVNRLSSDELLQRCLKGLTQNQNESLNGSLWLRCPKVRLKYLNLLE